MAINPQRTVLLPSLTLRRSSLETCHRHVSSANADRSLPLVLFHDAGAADFGFVGIFSEFALCPALAEQVPVLVEGDVDGFQPGLVVVAEGAPFVEVVLLVGEVLDVLDDGLIGGHGIFSFALRKDNLSRT